MDKKKDTINDINIEKVLTNYLQNNGVRSIDAERLILDDIYTDVTDKVMRKHWDSISRQMSNEKTNEMWKLLKEQTEVGMHNSPLKVHQNGIFQWAVAAIVFLAIMTNIYRLHQLEARKVINSSNVIVKNIVEWPVDSLTRELPEEEVDRQEIAQAAPALKAPKVEPIEVKESTEVVKREVKEEKHAEQPPQPEEHLTEHETRMGETLKLRLTDGTTVKLHENTKIIADFNDSLRAISLQGKAHFAVAFNRNISFQVSAQNVLIEVLGTEFEVDSRENAEQSAVRVDKGEVRVTTPDNIKFTLRSNQTLVFDNKSHSVSILRSAADNSIKKKRK